MARSAALLALSLGGALVLACAASASTGDGAPLSSGFAPSLEAIGIRDIQLLLAGHGYDPGPATGAMNEATYGAILAYQHDYGLAEDGIAGPVVQNALHFLKRRPILAAFTPPAPAPFAPMPPIVAPPAPAETAAPAEEARSIAEMFSRTPEPEAPALPSAAEAAPEPPPPVSVPLPVIVTAQEPLPPPKLVPTAPPAAEAVKEPPLPPVILASKEPPSAPSVVEAAKKPLPPPVIVAAKEPPPLPAHVAPPVVEVAKPPAPAIVAPAPAKPARAAAATPAPGTIPMGTLGPLDPKPIASPRTPVAVSAIPKGAVRGPAAPLTPQATPGDAALAPGDAVVREAQLYLKQLGFYRGEAHGVMDWPTVEALVKFDASGAGPHEVIADARHPDSAWLARLKTAAAAKGASQ
ncbi:MAG TPA: peptidoglycan-binding protein [Stellaceae bacterium]|nr:peptidoglycan-binding protein [Stellaceae bacterium]